MKHQKETIAIITARSGSKRIKNKNILKFFGKPMIAYSIIAAKNSRLFKKIYICTDSKKIKDISKKYGATFLSYRNKKLSDDYTGTYEVKLIAPNVMWQTCSPVMVSFSDFDSTTVDLHGQDLFNCPLMSIDINSFLLNQSHGH